MNIPEYESINFRNMMGELRKKYKIQLTQSLPLKLLAILEFGSLIEIFKGNDGKFKWDKV